MPSPSDSQCGCYEIDFLVKAALEPAMTSHALLELQVVGLFQRAHAALCTHLKFLSIRLHHITHYYPIPTS